MSQSFDRIRRDVAHTFRLFRRRPAFVALAATTLALGIGASTAIFTLVNAAVFRGVDGLEPPPGLVEISRDLDGEFFDVSYPVFRHVRAESQTLDDLAAVAITPISIGGEPEPLVVTALSVTGNYFSVLGLQPGLGRFFAPDRSFHPRVDSEVVISDHLWSTRFGGSRDVLGRTLPLNGHPAVVIGVAPEGFRGHRTPLVADVFVPLGLPAPGLEGAALSSPTSGVLELIGRLTPPSEPSGAETELGLLARSYLREVAPEAAAEPYVVRVMPWEPIPGVVRTPLKAFLALLMVVVGLALAITCTNVASLLLSRVTERRGELATRLAVGASRRHLVQQLLTESLVLFLVGGALGVLLAVWLVRLLLVLEPPLPPGITIALDLRIDWRVLAFAATVSGVTAVVFGLMPALRVASAGWLSALREQAGTSTPSRLGWRSALVGGQVAVTVLLLVVAGLLVRALVSMRSLDPGWDPAGVYVMPIDLELAGYSPERGVIFYETLLDELGSLPQVETATLAARLPLGGRSSMGDVSVDGLEPPPGRTGFQVYFNRVAPGYLATMRIPLLRGRDVAATDTEQSPRVVVINRAMATRLWPDEDPVGRTFHAGSGEFRQSFEVVGVAENATVSRLGEAPPNFVYLPYRQRFNHQMTVHVRTLAGADAGAVVAAMRGAVRDLDPGLPVQSVVPMVEGLEAFFLPQRLAAWVAGALGALGLLLAGVGIYGVTAFAAAQRRREVGVRLALGARPADVIRLLVLHGLRGPLVGAAAGVLVACLVTWGLGQVLAGVSPLDALAFAGALGGLGVVAGVAVVVPAARAARLEPAATLRAD